MTYRYVLCTNNIDNSDDVDVDADVNRDSDGDRDGGENCDKDGVKNFHREVGDKCLTLFSISFNTP